MEKFRNKYRIPSARLQSWDYRWAGAYFITICTKHRVHYFGEISNDITVETGHALSLQTAQPQPASPQNQMQLSHIGIIADILWYEIPNHSQNVELDAFVVMPNHIHGIIILNQNDGVDINGNDGGDRNCDGNCDGDVETGHALSLQPPQPPQPPQTIGQKRFQNIGKNSVSSIIGSYKSAVSKHAHRLGFIFEWQVRFHDHIIRDDEEYQRITNYINTNPDNWETDKFFKPEE